MKIRSGFVSNSSSSSFIVAGADDLTVTIKINLKQFVQYTFKTKEDILKYYDYNCGYESEEEVIKYNKKEYQNMLKAIEDGKTVYIGSVSSESDNGEEVFLLYGGLNNAIGVDIIEACDGY